MTIVLKKVKTPFGELLAGATSNGICLLEFTDTHRVEMQLSALEKIFKTRTKDGESLFFKPLQQQLDEYFCQKRHTFDLPFDMKGTPFQIQVWQALLTIPYGQTRSYQQQATIIQRPKAFRAVASANRQNRISILIPCHRVIAKNGGLAGYGGGLDRKKYLIQLEQS